jgi:two-component system sensor histidine kinase CpxA
MRSLFLRLFLWFCATGVLLFVALAVAWAFANPDQLPFAWPSIGRGAIVSAARVAIESYERGGKAELTSYLDSLHRDTGMWSALLDPSGHVLNGNSPTPEIPDSTLVARSSGLAILPGHIAAIRLPGVSGVTYTFVAGLPRRERSGFWSRTFLTSFILTGGLLCYFLARHITSPVVHLRTVTAQFSDGALSTRVTSPAVLNRRDEIGGLAADFNRMAARIESLMRAQQRMIADVSHELRSPLTRLSLALGLVERRAGTDSRQSLTRMKCELERLNALITQLLTLSRLECLEQPLPRETIDLRAMLQEIAADADFEAANMDRSVRLLDSDNCSIRGSHDLARSAIENVVRNALKYTDPNTDVTIQLLCRNNSGTATIIVEDCGPGIPVHALEHIFEPFYRVDEARDRRTGGVGLGLAIAYRIVALHGGSIHASNREGGGLEMRINLPSIAPALHPDKS